MYLSKCVFNQRMVLGHCDRDRRKEYLQRVIALPLRNSRLVV